MLAHRQAKAFKKHKAGATAATAVLGSELSERRGFANVLAALKANLARADDILQNIIEPELHGFC